MLFCTRSVNVGLVARTISIINISYENLAAMFRIPLIDKISCSELNKTSLPSYYLSFANLPRKFAQRQHNIPYYDSPDS